MSHGLRLVLCTILMMTALLGCKEDNPAAGNGNADAGSDGDDFDDERVHDDTGDLGTDLPEGDVPDDTVDASDTTEDIADGDTADVRDGGDADPDAEDGGDTDPDVPDDATGDGKIQIFLAGDLTPRMFEDGLSGQTPRD